MSDKLMDHWNRERAARASEEATLCVPLIKNAESELGFGLGLREYHQEKSNTCNLRSTTCTAEISTLSS